MDWLMPEVHDIPFRRIPRQTALFLDYLDLVPAALRFYHHAPTVESLERAARTSLGDFRFPRKEMASILLRQNEIYGGDSESRRRIEELEKSDSVAIVTGQQVGLFSGPLYTVFKALTAVHIAELLRKRGIRTIPIFWMDSEDHDLPEVTRRTVLDGPAAVQTLDYCQLIYGKIKPPLRAVGSMQFPESIALAVRDYTGHLPESAWKAEVQSRLESTYKPGATLALAFAQILMRILAGSGLVFFDPQDIEAKKLLAPVFRRALRESDSIHAALMHRKQELEAAGYHAQVHIQENSTVLFLFSDGERCALEKEGSRFKLKNSDQAFNLQELMHFADQAPEKFSPNVLLRPLAQDHLFPTIAYVGGSSELAYFAEIEVLYPLYSRTMPVIWPRNGFTLIEPEIAAAMDQWGVGLEDCFHGKESLIEKALRRSGFSKGTATLEQLENHLDRALKEIKPDMQAIELPLGDALENARRKILHNVRHLKSHAIRLEAAHNATLSNAVDSVLHHCYPKNNLQERELSILHFLARHGPSLLDTIHKATDIENFSHRVLQLE